MMYYCGSLLFLFILSPTLFSLLVNSSATYQNRELAPSTLPTKEEYLFADEHDQIMQDGLETAQRMLGGIENQNCLIRERFNGNPILVFTSDCCTNTISFKDSITPFLNSPQRIQALAKFFQRGSLEAIRPTDLEEITQKLCLQASSLAMIVTPESMFSNSGTFEILATAGKKITRETDEGFTFAELGYLQGEGYGLLLTQVAFQYMLPHVFEKCDAAYAVVSVTQYISQRNIYRWSRDHQIAGIFRKTMGSGSSAITKYVAVAVYGKSSYNNSKTTDPNIIELVIQHMRKKAADLNSGEDVKEDINGGLSTPLPVGAFTRDTLEIALKQDPFWRGDPQRNKVDFMTMWLDLSPSLASKP